MRPTRSALNGDGRFRVGIDIGGTFTDLVLMDTATGVATVGKTLTTPSRPADGVVTGVRQLLKDGSVDAGDVSHIMHATTLATNALVQRTGARTALVTTEGFRDALAMRDEGRYDLYDLNLELPEPLVPRRQRLEVRERILADGTVDTPVDAKSAARVIRTLRRLRVDAIAISFIHSYKNASHEREVASLIRDALPSVKISLSSEVAPEIREYPRTTTTVANAYVQGIIETYLADLRDRLESLGFRGGLYVMLSSGGVCTIDTAGRFPARLVESGPAAGALMAAVYATASGRHDVISFDMGGTTAKACLIEGGEPFRASEFEVARVSRFKKGSGMPLRAPVIELVEIGAGGGSIASVDELGLLRVGPESAGADPGPACYPNGGDRPTITDADLVLGYLDPDFFLGGKMRLSRERAETAIRSHIADRLDIGLEQAAWGIHRMVNETMAGAARVAAVERGKDPSGYPIIAFGGAGPVHAYGVARILRSPEVVVPTGAGVGSAFGLLSAPLSFDFVHSLLEPLDSLRWADVVAAFRDMERSGRAILESAGVADNDVAVVRSADLRFVGQGFEVNVVFPSTLDDADAIDLIRRTFAGAYVTKYGRIPSGMAVEVVNWRCVVTGPTPSILRADPGSNGRRVGDASTARKGIRRAYVPEDGGYSDVPIYDRYMLQPEQVFPGPAIVEEHESTTIVGRNAEIALDRMGNLVVRLGHG